MAVASLAKHRVLGPYADAILLLGPMLHERARTDPAGRPIMLVAATLAACASCSGVFSSFASTHQRLPLLVSGALREHELPIVLSASGPLESAPRRGPPGRRHHDHDHRHQHNDRDRRQQLEQPLRPARRRSAPAEPDDHQRRRLLWPKAALKTRTENPPRENVVPACSGDPQGEPN